ncbi:MAG: toxin [Candidatus Omnitrophica bacterium]|nr:toxin [Candidatus Omnitrophota bacterium]MBU1870339.1 toxin [Candidatus Omnitrophota bacterium]
MENIRWSKLKSERLKRTRGVSFEEIIQAQLLGIKENPNRVNQGILVYYYKRYVWAVPFVLEGEGIFLKTIYPSRKLRKIYQRRRNDEKD